MRLLIIDCLCKLLFHKVFKLLFLNFYMEEQLSMFAGMEPQIRYDLLTNPAMVKLEDIARRAVNQPLLFGERRESNNESRLSMVLKNLESKINIYQYLIFYQDNLIGYASIDDGWIPVEMEYTNPKVELAFIDPVYSNHASLVKRKLYDL